MNYGMEFDGILGFGFIQAAGLADQFQRIDGGSAGVSYVTSPNILSIERRQIVEFTEATARLHVVI